MRLVRHLRADPRSAAALAAVLALVAVLPAASIGTVRAPLPAALTGSFTGGVALVGGGAALSPSAVALDPARTTLFVVDRGLDQVVRYSAGLVTARQVVWGSGGSGPGQLNAPDGIAVDGAGHVYVADTGNDRIEEFTTAGAYVATLGSGGTGVGQLRGPTGLAVDTLGNLLVADTGNNRIQRHAVGGGWNVVGFADAPRGVAVDGIGLAYVANTGGNEIDVMASDGTVITHWSTATGALNAPTGIALDGAGSVFVTDAGNDRVVQSSTAGVVRKVWGVSGSGPSQFAGPTSVAVADTIVYVADPGNARVQQFVLVPTPPPTTPPLLRTWSTQGHSNGPDVADMRAGIAVDAAGNVIVPEGYVVRDSPSTYHYECSIARFDNSGTLLNRFGSVGPGPGQLCSNPSFPIDTLTAGVDGAGNIVIGDGTDNTVSTFAANGTYLRRLTDSFAEYLDTTAVAGAGPLYTVGAAGTGATIRTWDATSGSQTGSWSTSYYAHPSLAAVDPTSGDLLIPGGGGLVSRYTLAGALAGQWSDPNGLVGSLAVDASGNVYVSDSATTTVDVLRPDGSLIESFSTGIASGYLGSIGVDGAGDIYVYNDVSQDVRVFGSPIPVVPPPLFVRALGGSPGAGSGVSMADPGPQVAVGSDGSATVVWQVADGTNHIALWEATRPAGASAFADPTPIEEPAVDVSYDEVPAIATGPDGTTTVAWVVSDGTLNWRTMTATRPAGATAFSSPTPLESAPTPSQAFPRVAAGPDGSATVVWEDQDPAGATMVMAASRLSSSAPFVTSSLDPTRPVVPSAQVSSVAITPDGSTTAVWTTGSEIRVAVRAAGATAFGPTARLAVVSANTHGFYYGSPPQIVAGGDGVTTVAFLRIAADDQPRVWAAMRMPGAAAFAAPVQVEPTGFDAPRYPNGGDPALEAAAGADGTTTLAWLINEPTGLKPRRTVWTATRIGGTTAFRLPVGLGISDDETLAVAVGPSGDATVVWQVLDRSVPATEGVQASVRPDASSLFGPALRLVPGTTATDPSGPDPRVTEGSGGQVTVVWDATDQSYANQTVWEDSITLLPEAPAASAKVTRSVTATRTGSVRVAMRCPVRPAGGCATRATLRSRSTVLASRVVTIRAGGRVAVRLALGSRARALLRRKRTLGATLTLVTTMAGHRPATTMVTFTLHASR